MFDFRSLCRLAFGNKICVYDIFVDFGSSDPSIGFTAYAERNQVVHPGDVIYFTGLISNFDYSYDNNSSAFSCPYSGAYMFSAIVKLAHFNSSPYSQYIDLRIDGDLI